VPRGARVILLASVLLMGIGQFVGSSERTYPLAHWHMFSSANPAHRYGLHVVEGTTNSGQRVRLVPGALFPSVSRHLLTFNLQRTFNRIPRSPAIRTMTAAQRLRAEQALAALARRYNRMHPDDPLVGVEVMRVRLRFDPQQGTYTAESVRVMESQIADE